ncbi:MAG TPA: hypothetical protein VEF55_14740 [Candidatus Binatia bacterium]|nr:hypothetical protein [Candidatus Binatia bacterium]
MIAKLQTIDTTRALVVLSAMGLVAIGSALSFAPEADAARPHIIRDACTGTSGGGEGLECNSADDLLIRTQNPDGSCGAWVCCPPNGDGTYDCNRGSSPGGSQLSGALGNIAGARATAVSPGVAVDPSSTQRAPTTTRRARRAY